MKAPELKERLEESEKLIQEMTVTWEEKLRKTEAIALVMSDDMHKHDMNFIGHFKVCLLDEFTRVKKKCFLLFVAFLHFRSHIKVCRIWRFLNLQQHQVSLDCSTFQ